MGLSACPVAIVGAPVDVVWANLVQWERYIEWADVEVDTCEPEGPAAAVQTVTFGGKAFGRTLHFIFKVEAIDAEQHRLDVHAFFPFGLQERAHIACTPIDATSCRVQYG